MLIYVWPRPHAVSLGIYDGTICSGANLGRPCYGYYQLFFDDVNIPLNNVEDGRSGTATQGTGS